MISRVELDESQASTASAGIIPNGFKTNGTYRKGREQPEENVRKDSQDSVMGSSVDLRRLMSIACAFYWLVITVVIVPTASICTQLIFLWPILMFSRKLYNWLEHELCWLVNGSWVACGQYSGLNIIEYGDDITQYADKRCLCLANHLGLVDHFCLMSAFHDKSLWLENICG
uniref:Uncharacterized protein n=1 Tax=Ditylenchus dipsaci TaxID=166011 RepID=A0A915D525_9BILA